MCSKIVRFIEEESRMVVASGTVKGKNREALVKGYLSIHPSCAHLCPTLCDSMDYSPPGFSIHGISQARILEWVAISSSRGSSWPRDQTHVSCVSYIAGNSLLLEPSGRPLVKGYLVSFIQEKKKIWRYNMWKGDYS